MNEKEYLLTCLSEECAEVIQAASKALRFGLSDIQPGQMETNAQRLNNEINDVFALVYLLRDELISDGFSIQMDPQLIASKKNRVIEFMRYSQEIGTLES